MKDFMDSLLPGLTLGVFGLIIMDIIGWTDSRTAIRQAIGIAKQWLTARGYL